MKEYEQEILASKSARQTYDENSTTVAYIPQAERDKLDKSDFAWPEERKYPITNQAHLDAAIRLIGRAPKDKQAMIKENIKRIAKRKNLSLPDGY